MRRNTVTVGTHRAPYARITTVVRPTPLCTDAMPHQLCLSKSRFIRTITGNVTQASLLRELISSTASRDVTY